MTRLRWHLIGLLIWLIGLTQINHLGAIAGGSVLLVHPVGLALGVLVALLPLAPVGLDRVRRPALLASALVYVGVTAGASMEVTAPVIVIGLGLVTVTWFLSERVAQDLHEFAHAVALVTLAAPDGRELRSLDATRELIDIEMVRSRRFERPLSLVIVEPDPAAIATQAPRLVAEMQQKLVQRYVQATTARVLMRALRRTDMVLADDLPGRLVLVTPETNTADAGVLGSRAARLVRDRLGLNARYGIASFPQQALTFDDLRTVAEADLCRQAASCAERDVLDLAPRSSMPAAEQERVRI